MVISRLNGTTVVRTFSEDLNERQRVNKGKQKNYKNIQHYYYRVPCVEI